VWNDCLDNRRDLGPRSLVSRIDYYTHIAALTGVDVATDDAAQRQLYVLLAGLRDNVARCGTLTGAGVYGLVFGAAAETTRGRARRPGQLPVRLVGDRGRRRAAPGARVRAAAPPPGRPAARFAPPRSPRARDDARRHDRDATRVDRIGGRVYR
jgi:hypothetical protein